MADLTTPDAFPDQQAWVPWVGLIGMGTVLGFVLWSGRGVVPEVDLTASAVSVNARGFGQTITYAAIDSVTLRRNLDGVGARRTATQSGSTYLGTFDMAPYGTATLFVDAGRKPFVVVHARDGVTIVSAGDSADAMALASSLQRAAADARRKDEGPR